MNPEELKKTLEAILMTADGPLNVNALVKLFEKDVTIPEKSELREALKALQEDYIDRGVELKEVANGFRFQVRPEYATWVNRLFEEKPPRYSRALLETLAIIAYRQPITRAEIENIRGVSVNSSIIRTLQEREWVKVVGHRDVPGKPELLATSKEFLDYFNLKKLSELPSLSEIKDLENINPDLFDQLEKDSGTPAATKGDDDADGPAQQPILEVVEGDKANEEEASGEQQEQAEEIVPEANDTEETEADDDVDDDVDNVIPISG